MDWNAVAALGGLIAAIAAIVTLVVQSRQAAFIAGVELMLKLDERFESAEMVAKRRHAARGLLENRPEAALEVLNFIELVGLLARRKALDLTMVWHDLSYWIIPYVDAAADYIQQCRRDDRNVWSEALWLAEQMSRIEQANVPRGCLQVGESRDEFLRNEVSRCHLEGDGGAA